MLRKIFIVFLVIFLVLPFVVKPVTAQDTTNPQYFPAFFRNYPRILANPDFEAGQTGWTETVPSNVRIIINQNDAQYNLPVTPWNGQWVAWLGGILNSTQSISQQVYINPEIPHLAFYQIIGSAEDVCGRDVARVVVNGAVVSTYNLCTTTETANWDHVSFNLSTYAGQDVTVAIEVVNDNTEKTNSNLFVDGFTFESAAVP